MKVSNTYKAASEMQPALRRRNSKGITVSQNLSSNRFLSAASSYLPMATASLSTSLSTSRPRPKSTMSNSDIAKSMESRLTRRNSYASTVNSKTSADSVISLRSNNSDIEESMEASGISATSNAIFEGDFGFDEGIILTSNPALADRMREPTSENLSPPTSITRRQRPKSLSFHLPNVDVHGESLSRSLLDNGPPVRSTSRGSISSSVHSSEPGSIFSTINSRTSTLSTASSSSGLKKRDNIEQKVSQMVQWMQHRQAASIVESRILTMEKAMAEADTLKLDISSRWDHLLASYKELRFTQNELAKKVKEKDEEIDVIQSMYQDAIDENQILYQTFNEELEQLLKITEKNGLLMDHRPAHPTPEDQIKRKLKAVVKERNGWQHLARYVTKTTLLPDQLICHFNNIFFSDLEKELFILKSNLQT